MELTQKGEMVSRLQAKAGQIGKILNNLEKYNHLAKEQKSADKKHSKSDAKKAESEQAKKKKVEAEPEGEPKKLQGGDPNG